MAKTVRSRKAKGKRLENKVVETLKRWFNLTDDEIRRTPASVTGEDIILSESGQKKFPFSIECKNSERLNIWSAIGQAVENAKGKIPLVIFTKNRSETYVVLPINTFLNLWFNYLKVIDHVVNPKAIFVDTSKGEAVPYIKEFDNFRLYDPDYTILRDINDDRS